MQQYSFIQTVLVFENTLMLLWDTRITVMNIFNFTRSPPPACVWIHEGSRRSNTSGKNMKLGRLLTCITEHLVLHNDLVAVQGLWVHFVVCVLVGKVEQNLAITEMVNISKSHNRKQAVKSRTDS